MCRSNVDINSSIATLACIFCSRSFVQDSFVNVPHSRGEGRRSGYPRTLKVNQEPLDLRSVVEDNELPAQFLKPILYVLQWQKRQDVEAPLIHCQDRIGLHFREPLNPLLQLLTEMEMAPLDTTGMADTLNLCDSSNIK